MVGATAQQAFLAALAAQADAFAAAVAGGSAPARAAPTPSPRCSVAERIGAALSPPVALP